MKRNEDIRDWAGRYQDALCALQLKATVSGAKSAASLGRQAAALGLETLDIAKVHERSLRTLLPAKGSARASQTVIARAQRFFSEALVPIERKHRAVRNAEVRVEELTLVLRQRQRETSTAKRKLKQGVSRRQSTEAALRASDAEHARLLKESQNLQQRLRYRIRRLILLQEDEWNKTSLQMRNEIAQTLLAIHVRLLALKEAGMANKRKLSKEIAETQGLVRESGKTLARLANDSKKIRT